jgi:hypothetical protein
VPTSPLFYVVFLAFYLCLPLSEGAVFRLLWSCPVRLSLPVLLRKRIYSRYLVDYSGEAYLYLWARRALALPERHLLHSIKDNIIVSTATSTAVGLVTLAIMVSAGVINLPADMEEHAADKVATAALLFAVLVAAAYGFRRRLFFLPRRTFTRLSGIHTARLLTLMVLQLVMWSLADPGVSLRSWMPLLAADVVISRIPFLPNRDFILLGTGLQMAGGMGVGLPMLAGMLLTVSVLDKVLALLLVIWSSAVGARRRVPEPPRSSAPAQAG